MSNVKVNGNTYNNIESIKLPLADGTGYVFYNEDTGKEQQNLVSDFLTKKISGVYYNDEITEVGTHAFSGQTGITEIDLPNVTTVTGIGVFQYCTSLKSVKLPKAISWKSVSNPVINMSSVFAGCTSLETISLPGLNYMGTSGMFQNCTSLKKALVGNVTTIPSNSFMNAPLETLVLNRTESFVTLSGFSSGSLGTLYDTTLKVYVPSALVDTYKSAERWVNMADRIFAIEDYPDEVNF